MNILGVINDRSYGIVTYKILEQLKCTFWPLYNVQEGLDLDYNLIKQCIDKQNSYSNTKSVRIWHQFDLAQHVGSPRIGFPIFELNKFNTRELNHLKNQDLVLVCSKWAQEVLNSFNIKSKVVPLGVDKYESPKELYHHEPYRFITIGKWEIRKGHDKLVEVFNKAFDKENVELWMCCSNPFLNPQEQSEWENIYKKSKLGNKIKIIPWQNSHKALLNIISQTDCGVFLSRAEGWNMGALEVMSMGKPVILTDYSGHTEYATKHNSFLINIDNLELAVDGKWFFGQGEWASLDDNQIDQAVEHMRFCYQNRPTNQHGLETANKFTWAETARLVREA